MLFGPDVAQKKINEVLENLLLALESSTEDKMHLQELYIFNIHNIIEKSDEGIISQIHLDNALIEKLQKNECKAMLFELRSKGFPIPLYSNSQYNRFDNRSKLGLITEVATLTDAEILSDTVHSHGIRDIAKKAMCLVGDYCGDVANRNLKELNARIETIIYNVTILAGQEAGFELTSFISGIIADTTVDLASKYGTSYILDHLTGASMGYLVQTALDMDSLKGDAKTAAKIADILSQFLTKGASDTFASGFAGAFTRFLSSERTFPGLHKVLAKHLVAKPGLCVSKMASSKVNKTFELLEKPSQLYNQTKDAIHDNITSPIVQTIYRGPLRDFVKGYYGGLCGEFSKKASKEFADKHIKGKIKICLDEYIDHLFPGKPLTYDQYMALEDLTDNFSVREAQRLRRKEAVEKMASNAAKEYAKEAYPQITESISEMGNNLYLFLENALNIPQSIVEKMLEGEELSLDDLNEINIHKYGQFTNQTIQMTTNLFSMCSNALNYVGLTVNHEAVAQECAQLLASSFENLEEAPALLNKLTLILASHGEKDKEKIEEIFRNILNKNHYFITAVRKFLENSHAIPTPMEKKLNDNMLCLIRWFVENNYNPNQLDERGVSPLHLVIAKVKNEALCVQMLKSMLKCDSDFTATTLMGNENILHLAAFHGKYKVVKFLMSLPDATKRDLLNGKTRNLKTPLHCAIKIGYKKEAIALINNGASLTALDANDSSPFALAKDNLELFVDPEIKAALQRRLTRNLENDMDTVSMLDQERERRILLTLTASPQEFMEIELTRFKEGYHPYLAALLEDGQIAWAHHLVFGLEMQLPFIHPKQSKTYCLDLIKRLSKRSSVEAADLLHYLLEKIKQHSPENFYEILNLQSNDYTALIQDAVEAGNGAAIDVLLNYGADINALSMQGDPLLLVALKNNQYAAAKLLLEKGANPLKSNAQGENAVTCWESMYHNPYSFNKEYLALYQEMSAKLDLTNVAKNYLHKDTNALMTYCRLLLKQYKDLDFIKKHLGTIFKKYPQFINAKDCHGQTLLHYAHAANLPEISLWLMQECKASPFIEDNKKHSFCTAWNSYANVGLNPWKKGARKEITAHLAALTSPEAKPQELDLAANKENNTVEEKFESKSLHCSR